jgi:hypothetical protein
MTSTPLSKSRFLIQFVLAQGLVLPLAAADWPQWRGVNRDGHSAERGLLQEWPAAGPKLPCPIGGVVKFGDYFYGSSEPSVMCINFRTGAIQWQERSPNLSWLVADRRLYALAENGEVLLIEPTPQAYRERGRFTPTGRPAQGKDGKVLAHPVLADGRLYLREQNCLWCYDVKAKK